MNIVKLTNADEISLGKFLKYVLTIFGCLYCFTFFSLRWWYKKNYSDEKYMSMVSDVSSLRDVTNDMCKYAIFGDPINTGENFIKIEFLCKNGQSKINSLSTIAIDGDVSLEKAMTELGRILNVSTRTINENKWSCFKGQRDDNKVDVLWNDKLIKMETITCDEI